METKPDYQEGFIQGDGVKLQYLDWGGNGQPLILLHGLGDSPFLFEDLATFLKNNFRIIAYSRRGHGKSEANSANYDIATLVSDLKLLLDSMKIDKANLLGWSMGGNEITEFAIRYPERINKLIYFEAGYDLSDEAFSQIVKNLPKQPLPDSADLLSLNTYRKWYHSFWFSDVEWNSSLEDNLRASTIIHQDSSVTTLPDDQNFKNILESIMSYHRDYKNIQVPALAFFTNQFFVPPVKNEEVVSAYANLEKNIITPWRLKNINQLKAEFKNVTIKILPRGSHVSFIYLCKDSLVEAINSFLLNK